MKSNPQSRFEEERAGSLWERRHNVQCRDGTPGSPGDGASPEARSGWRTAWCPSTKWVLTIQDSSDLVALAQLCADLHGLQHRWLGRASHGPREKDFAEPPRGRQGCRWWRYELGLGPRNRTGGDRESRRADDGTRERHARAEDLHLEHLALKSTMNCNACEPSHRTLHCRASIRSRT